MASSPRRRWTPLDEHLRRRAGVPLAATGTSDVIDAAPVVRCADGDEVVTPDPDDVLTLAAAAGTHVELDTV